MIQQVNLYLPELRPQKEWVTANSTVLCVSGALIVSMVLSILADANNRKMETHIVELEQLQEVAQVQFDSVKSLAITRNTLDLDQKIQTLRTLIRNKQDVGRIIEYQNFGNAEGFSRAMDAIAEHSKNTIELRRFFFDRGLRHLSLKGQTIQPKDIASYIESLSDDPVFTNTQFGALQLNKLEQQPRLHEFSLGESSHLQVVIGESP